MLGFGHSFVFPKIRYYNESKFKSWSSDQEGCNIYTLDWKIVDPKGDGWFRMKEPYCKITEGPFAIPPHYLEGIRHYSRLAKIEWSKRWGYDTNIREMCLVPGIEAANTALKLVADCAYDEKKDYFDRSVYKPVRKYAMMWRFWQYQTGWGCVRSHAHISDLEQHASAYNPTPQEEATIQGFLELTKEFEGHQAESLETVVQVKTQTSLCLRDVRTRAPIKILDNNAEQTIEVWREGQKNGLIKGRRFAVPLYPSIKAPKGGWTEVVVYDGELQGYKGYFRIAYKTDKQNRYKQGIKPE